MVLLVDVGNTNTVFGVVVAGELRHQLRLRTDYGRTADELAALVLPLFDRLGIVPLEVEAFWVSSVVPPLHPMMRILADEYFGAEAVFVEAGIKTGLSIRSDNPAEVGADRIVNAVAARDLYGVPTVAVDFGTATTFDVVDTRGDYIGGIIAPGIGISAEALFAQASKLYRVDLQEPKHLIGRNTAGAVQSGVYFGYLGLVDGILQRLKQQIEGLQTVVATGGMAPLIAAGSNHITEVNDMLTLQGLRLIYERNIDRGPHEPARRRTS
ncbi:MAG: type III pantothenate kinase [Thermoanaerobaculia bacterium]|nr:type III pantothenate kinase [Thermoanaerobaculia bacterium]